MSTRKILVVFFVLIAKICSGHIAVETTAPRQPSSRLIDATVDILLSCYGERGPIGVFGNLPPNFLARLWSKKPIPVVLMNRDKRAQSIRTPNQAVVNSAKPQVLLFVMPSCESIKAFVRGVQSKWSINTGPIIVLSTKPCNAVTHKSKFYDPQMVLGMLKADGMYNVNVLCEIPAKGILIFCANPHTNRAPPSWTTIGDRFINNTAVHIFLFVRIYQSNHYNAETCKNLNFDRTIDLGKDEMEILVRGENVGMIENWRDDIMYNRRISANVLDTLVRQMNATSKIHVLTERNAGYGINAVPQPIQVFGVNLFIPSIYYSDIIVIQHRGYKTQLQKITSIFDTYAIYCMAITAFITVIFFKFVADQHFISAMLNIFRMFSNAGFTNLPDTVASKVFLVCLFPFIVSTSGIISGKLVSLLTTQIPLRHPETVQDLIHMKYKIFMDRTIYHLYSDRPSEAPIIELNDTFFCPEYVANHAMTACVENKAFLTLAINHYNLYGTKEVFFSPMGYHVTRLWRFKERVATILLRMGAAHIMEPLDMRVTLKRMNEKRDYLMNRKALPKVVTMSDLGFAFIILGIGLGCASISFIIEISIKSVRSRIVKVRRYPQYLES